VRHGRVRGLFGERGRSVTYELRHVLCGKKHCRKLHGPYWYGYYSKSGRVRTVYIGKHFEPLIMNSTGFLVKKPRPIGELEDE
jgi:hypothetical protein